MYKYTHFIPENIAPTGAKEIGVYNSAGKRVASIPLGRLAPYSGQKRYSFCALADIHLTYDTANTDFQRALTFAESNCDFTCIAGDLTSTGSITEGATNEMALYKSIVTNYAKTKPVYAISGNHETSYGTYITDDRIQPYTGNGLYYSFTKGNDVFIMLGYYGAYHETNGGWRSDEFLSVQEIQWLYRTLEANRNKRCFIFQHVLPHEHGVGNANGLYQSALIFNTKDNGIGQSFINLLRHYKNTIFFHGHSHIRFGLQELDEKANYSDVNGYRSVHIPSLSVPREMANGSLSYAYAESEGYVVDVYDNCIVLNGRDFIDNDADGHCIPIATYKIDTTLQTIEANTFTDSTGIMMTCPDCGEIHLEEGSMYYCPDCNTDTTWYTCYDCNTEFCSHCGYYEDCDHEWEYWYSDEGDGENHYWEEYCTECGEVWDSGYEGHNWTYEYSDNADGTHHFISYCPDCGFVEDEFDDSCTKHPTLGECIYCGSPM